MRCPTYGSRAGAPRAQNRRQAPIKWASEPRLRSIDRQLLLNNAIALARTAVVFGIPVVASTSASKVYSGPLMPGIKAALPEVQLIERRSMNLWKDEAARGAVDS